MRTASSDEPRSADGARRSRAAAAGPWLLAAACLALAAAIPFDTFPWLRGPAPYPPEWQWAYRAEGPARPLASAALAAASLLGLLLISGTSWARARPRLASRALLGLATLAGVWLQLALLEREPQGALRALMARALSPSIGSYHTVAVSEEARDPIRFLRSHARLLPQLLPDRKHAATHPPGPVLWYRAALAACEGSRTLSDRLLALAGVPAGRPEAEQGRAIRAAALLGALGLGLCAVLALWPLALLAETLGHAPLSAARLALLWPLLPATGLFTPALDGALALPVATCAWLLARAGTASRARPLLEAALAGLCGGVALFLSYGAAAFLALGVTAVLAATEGVRLARVLSAATLAAGVAATLALGLPAALGHQPLLALRTALGLHRALFTAPRDPLVWLLFNPVDFGIFLGAPVAALAAWATAGSLRRLRGRSALDALDRFRLALAAGIGLLLLAGVTRGEVGRLWVPLMPFTLLAAGGDVPANDGWKHAWRAVGLGILIAASTLAIGAYWVV